MGETNKNGICCDCRSASCKRSRVEEQSGTWSRYFECGHREWEVTVRDNGGRAVGSKWMCGGTGRQNQLRGRAAEFFRENRTRYGNGNSTGVCDCNKTCCGLFHQASCATRRGRRLTAQNLLDRSRCRSPELVLA